MKNTTSHSLKHTSRWSLLPTSVQSMTGEGSGYAVTSISFEMSARNYQPSDTRGFVKVEKEGLDD